MKSYLGQRILWVLACLLLATSPLLAQNIALGKAALASSAVQAASRAFDGDMGTRWESASSDSQYLIVDLGSVQSIDRIRLSWETALGKNFTLDISSVTTAPSDDSWTNVVSGTWNTAVTVTNNTATTNDYPNLGKSGRYVRMNGTARSTSYGYSLYEFALYAYDPNPNLALGKTATASASPVQAAANAFDGSSTSRWESAYTDAQYIMVDLGAVQTIDRIRLTWESALGKDFTLDISSDGTTWQTAVTVTGNTSTSNEYAKLGKTGRYVRMNGTKRGTSYGYSLYEFEVFSYDPNPNLALGKMATASASPMQAVANAFDGNGTTRWESAYTDAQYITVDLGAVQAIDRIRLTWESALGKDFTLDISSDGTTWQTAVTVTGNTSTSNEYANLGKTGRYVRMNGTKRGTSYGYSLYEFEVFASSNNATNLANARQGVASTTQADLSPDHAFDNDRLTRWASTAGRDDASIYVDLRGAATISRVYLVWEKAYGGNFTIDVSDDAKTWTTVATTADNSSHFNEYTFTTPVTGRYVRMNGTKRGTTSADNGYSLYEFQINGTTQPLPVTLTSFDAAAQGTGVAVSWATASEQHNAGFEVQRSADGANFATLATVAGMGTTQSAHTYRYFDAAPLRTTSYYRLKQLDLDGTFAYSPVVAVLAAGSTALSIYPNPTTDRATITWETPIESAGRWYLTNSMGQVVHTAALGGENASTLALDLQAYPAGIYVVTVESAGKVVRRGRVQKSN